MNYQHTKTVLLLLFLTASLYACGGDVGGNEDKINPVVTLTSLNDGEEVIGAYKITWATDDPNRSFVDIELSSDSGMTYQLIEARVPDTGIYDWDTNAVLDCRACRVQITATDIAGNVGDPAESAQDFIVNNVPQVLGAALFYDNGQDAFNAPDNGPSCGDSVVIPFDKDIEIRSPQGRDFQLVVAGDSFGSGASVVQGPGNNEVTLTLSDASCDPAVSDIHLHVSGKFDPARTSLTGPSGFDVIADLPPGIIRAVDTGRTAEPSGAIDIAPTFSDLNAQLLGTTQALAVALGDVDNDGDMDLVAGNYGVWGPADQVWLNGGDNSGSNTGVFADSGQLLGNDTTRSVVLGDVDDDGDLDMLLGKDTGNRVWMNNISNTQGQEGVFTDSGQVLGSASTFASALGDVDGDGDIDFVAGNVGANQVWFNNGGVFTDSGQSLGNSFTRSVVLGDVDGDGDLDLVAGNKDGEANRVWINNINNTKGQEGVFTDSGQMLGNDLTFSMALGDLDDDGDQDLVIGNDGGANRVWINNMNNTQGQEGVFTDSGQLLGNNATRSVVLGDVDGDDDLDIIAGNNNQANRVWINNVNNTQGQEGVFTDSGQLLGNNATSSIAMADIDGDDDLDLVEGVASSSAVNNGNRVWINSQRSRSKDFIINSGQALSSVIASGDVDGDGDNDLITSLAFQMSQRVLLNNIDGIQGQEGVFTDSGQELGIAETINSMVLGDVDGDADLDLVIGYGFGKLGASYTYAIWMNNINNAEGQEGVFADSGQIFGSAMNTSVIFGDVDGDGDLDLVAGGLVLINNISNTQGQEGVYTDSNQMVGDSTTSKIHLGDVDGDGDLDLVTGNYATGSQLWINNITNTQGQEGVFTDSGQSFGVNDAESVALGDVDGDGDLDLVVGLWGASNQLWINNIANAQGQEGVFVDSGQSFVINNTVSVSFGDMNGDGNLDIVEGNSGQPNKVYINNGKGEFADWGLALGNNSSWVLIVDDVDSDGDLDMVDGDSSAASQVWLNDF